MWWSHRTSAGTTEVSIFKFVLCLGPGDGQTLLDVAREAGAFTKEDGLECGIQWFVHEMVFKCHQKKEKLVIFSEYLHSLDWVEEAMEAVGALLAPLPGLLDVANVCW